MEWREKLIVHLGPGCFAGITLGDWLSLLRENRFAVSPSYLIRAASIFLQAIPNTAVRKLEDFRFQKKWNSVAVLPPLFILGHYRHGTTHLHNLLSIDRRFAFPNMYQVNYPHTFLTTEGTSSKLADFFVPRKRPFDNVRMGMEFPNEDEMAMITAAGVSPYLSLVFPRRIAHYDKHLSFQNASANDISRWQEALILFLRKLTLKYGKPLIVKSPPHTARIRLLLEMFPQAKFVHIRRNPSEVFSSTLRMFSTGSRLMRLQNDEIDLVRRTIDGYREMYNIFFEECDLIPSGRLHEISFEELDRNPIEEVKRMYEALEMPDFSVVEPDLQ